MAGRSEYTIAFDAPAENVYQDFTSPRYWESLADAYRSRIPLCEVVRFSSDENGTDVTLRSGLKRKDLPPVVRAVIPVDMVVTREQHFDAYDHEGGRATGSYRASAGVFPGQLSGDSFLTGSGTGTGSQLRLLTSCRVPIPLVGAKVEGVAMHYVTWVFDTEQTFMADWIAKRRQGL